jgi:hypothetical protein
MLSFYPEADSILKSPEASQIIQEDVQRRLFPLDFPLVFINIFHN